MPIFFASVGASVDLRALATLPALSVGGALMLMVVVTTFVTPPLLVALSKRNPPGPDAAPDDSGIDDLVSGSAHRKSKATSIH